MARKSGSNGDGEGLGKDKKQAHVDETTGGKILKLRRGARPKMPGRESPKRSPTIDEDEIVETRKASPNTSRAFDIEVPKSIADKVKALRERYANDFVLFAEECLEVIDRDAPEGARIVPLKLTLSQLYIHSEIGKIEEFNLRVSAAKRQQGLDVPLSKLPVETVLVKARKVMASTYFRARAFWKNEFQPGHSDLVMAHEKDVAQNLAEIGQRFHRGWVEKLPTLRRQIVRCADNLIEWDHDARTIVKTAGSKSGGASQGYTYHYEHLSELSRYADGTTELASATTAAATFREIHIESTPRGENEFKAQWDKALWLADAVALFESGKPFPLDWNKKFRLFWAWHQDPAYAVALTKEQKKYVQKTLDDDERKLIVEHQLTFEQLQWRRDKIANECSQQRDLPPKHFFQQEYPSSPEEGFVTKGSKVFDREALLELEAAAKNIVRAFEAGGLYNAMPYFVGTLVRDKRLPEGFRLQTTGNIRGANLVLWNPPIKRREYVIGADTAEGLERSDDSVAAGFDRTTGLTLVETFRYIGKSSGEELAEIVFYLHKLYNDAFVVGERNSGSGATMCLKLVRLGCHNLYHFKNPEEFSDRDEPESFTAGFLTSPRTKRMIAECTAYMLRDKQLILRHPDAIEQFLAYENVNGKLSAPHGKNDDNVSATMLACYGHQPDVGPVVWASSRHGMDDEEFEKLTAEQQINYHYKKRVEKVIAAARDRNKRDEDMVKRARLVLDRRLFD